MATGSCDGSACRCVVVRGFRKTIRRPEQFPVRRIQFPFTERKFPFRAATVIGLQPTDLAHCFCEKMEIFRENRRNSRFNGKNREFCSDHTTPPDLGGPGGYGGARVSGRGAATRASPS